MKKIIEIQLDDHLKDEGIAQYVEALDNDNLELIPHEIKVHVEECDDCKNKIVEIYALISQEFAQCQEDKHEIQSGQKITPKRVRMFQFFGIAAVILCLAISPILIYKNVLNTKSDYAIDHLDFKENQIWESLICTIKRSAFNNKISFTPEIGENINTDSIKFEWQSSVKLNQLVILDNHGIDILTSPVSGNKLIIDFPYPPGLYYWKLESENDLIVISKFLYRYQN